jgi:hypothetical protein
MADRNVGRGIEVCEGKVAGAAMSTALRASRQERDEHFLEYLTHSAARIRDRNLYEAAFEIAGDSTASLQARVISLRTLLYQFRTGSRYTYADLVTSTCLGSVVSDWSYEVGDALPSDHRSRILSLSTTIAGDTAQSPELRNAASCVKVLARHAS